MTITVHPPTRLVSDPSPTLGGNLDANGHAITGVSQLAIGGDSANDYTGAWRLGYRTAEATLSGTSTAIQVNIPAGAKLVGTLLRVDTAITSGNGATSWTAAYTGGASATIGTGLAFAKNTKANALFNPYAATPIATSEVDIVVSANSGSFSGGVVHAQVFFEYLENLGNAP